MPRKSKLTPQAIETLEHELIALLVDGKELPPGYEHLIQTPEFVKKVEQRKSEVALQKQQMAQHVLSPVGMGSLAIAGILQKSAPSVSQETLQSELPQLMARLKCGDGTLLEEVLLGQVLTLQTLASNLIAQGSIQSEMNQKQTLLHLGLKAGNQLRQTVGTLNELRNPRRATFIKRQLNQLHIAENSKKLQDNPNELLAGSDNGTPILDTRTAAPTERSHPALDALEG